MAIQKHRGERKETQIEDPGSPSKWGYAAVILGFASVAYVLSPPFALSFLVHMYDWFGIETWFGMQILELLNLVYFPLEILGGYSETYDTFMNWYMGIFPDSFLWGASGPPFLRLP